MGGAPPLPLDFTPQGLKKGDFLPFFESPRIPVLGLQNGQCWYSEAAAPVPKPPSAALVRGGARGPRTRDPGPHERHRQVHPPEGRMESGIIHTLWRRPPSVGSAREYEER